MSYVLHVYRMTYKMYDMQEYIFVHPRNGILCPPFFGIYLFHPLDIAKNESFLGGFAPPATWANHRSVFNGIRFYSFQNIVSFWVTPKRTCLSVISSSVVGQLRWKEHIKKHKKVSDFSHKQIRFYIFAQN